MPLQHPLLAGCQPSVSQGQGGMGWGGGLCHWRGEEEGGGRLCAALSGLLDLFISFGE